MIHNGSYDPLTPIPNLKRKQEEEDEDPESSFHLLNKVGEKEEKAV